MSLLSAFILQSSSLFSMENFIESFFPPALNTLLTIVIVIAVYVGAKYLLKRQMAGNSDGKLIRQIVLFLLGLVGFISILIAPLNPTLQKEVLGLFGIVLSATFALASTTFLGNALAGIMNRITNSCQPGDFIRVKEYSGRISDRGLFHIELQTEDRDLTTLPNLFLANNPVKVIRNSGTIISATASLGYDVSRKKIEACLIEAAKKADLEEPFVYIIELGDFSINYKVHGLLTDTRRILTAKSRLYAMMLDELHEAKIEIVSPGFVNQRQVNETVFIPKKVRKEIEIVETENPEALMFDKADQAENLEEHKQEVSELEVELEKLEEQISEASDDVTKTKLERRIKRVSETIQKNKDELDKGLEELKNKE